MVSFLLHEVVFFHVKQTKILVVNFRTGVFHRVMHAVFIVSHLSLVNLFFIETLHDPLSKYLGD